MAGIYVPGVERPENCLYCPCYDKHYVCNASRRHLSFPEVYCISPEWCQMQFVPDHGDLIDREKLYEQTANWDAQALDQVLKHHPEKDRDEWRWWSAVLNERSAFKRDVADAPTVIPADKGGEA